MNLLFRFTLTNAIEGSLEIHEPEGWDDGILKLERNENYHSLVEYYAQPLTFDDAIGNGLSGGLSYIRTVETTQGPDAQITITIELSDDDGESYETCFVGILDFDTLKETDFYKLQCGVKRDDFWSKFINRKAIPVDLSSIVDLDGNDRTPVNGFTLPLPSQKIRLNFDGNITTENGDIVPYVGLLVVNNALNSFTTSDKIQITVEPKPLGLDEIETRFNLPVTGSVATPNPVNTFKVKYAGVYPIDMFHIAYGFDFGIANETQPSLNTRYYHTDTKLILKMRVNNGTPISFTPTNRTFTSGTSDYYGLSGITVRYTEWILSEILTLQAGDEITVYSDILSTNPGTTTDSPGYFIQGTGVGMGGIDIISLYGSPDPSLWTIAADTTSDETETEAYDLKDAAESILSKLTGADDVVQSAYLDGGCGDKYAITKGLNVRGYSFADKPFFLTFDKWWNGANPILNLGLGYEAGNKIRIEQKGFFYDKTSTSIDLDFVNNIERSYAMEFIVKSIEMGYNKWSAESASGVDDPQSKRTWRTRFATIGKDEKLLSEFIAASLAIEQTRRNRAELGKDWRLDEDVMIIAVNPDLSPLSPEFDENFSEITGLLNSDARYNIRLSVARNFERWKEYFNGCLQWYVNNSPEEEYKFASGEGNFDMVTRLFADDCEATGVSPEPAIDEKGNVAVTDDFYFMPIMYEFEHPLEFDNYKTIRDNPTLAIGVSRTATGHKKCFIMNIDYKPTHGLGTFTVMLAENDPL